MEDNEAVMFQELSGKFVDRVIENGNCPSCLMQSMFVFAANEIIHGFDDDAEGMKEAQKLLAAYWTVKAEAEQGMRRMQ